MLGKGSTRTLTCFRCVHRGLTTTSAKRCYCELTKRTGNIERGYYCDKFERLETKSCDIEFDGFVRRNLQVEDYRTAKQWKDAGRAINEGAEGRRMYANGTSSKTFVYYLLEETHEVEN